MSAAAPHVGRRTPAEVGDLVCAQLQNGDWCVFEVAVVDREGSIACLKDEDGSDVAVYRVLQIDSPWLVSSRKLTRSEGVAELVGLASPDIEDIKAAFRKWVLQ